MGHDVSDREKGKGVQKCETAYCIWGAAASSVLLGMKGSEDKVEEESKEKYYIKKASSYRG